MKKNSLKTNVQSSELLDSRYKPHLDFNENIILCCPNLREWINDSVFTNDDYQKSLEQLEKIDHGGFNHNDLSSQYSNFQTDKRYGSTRLVGWKNLFSLLINSTSPQQKDTNGLILDFLSGSGTLSQRASQIWHSFPPQIMGIDTSFKMCQEAKKNNAAVFWGSHDLHPFKSSCADACVAAYGFHHVPEGERKAFVRSMALTLSETGVCLLHDFVEGSSSSRLYSELIHAYRNNGHHYKHFTTDEFHSLLHPHFFNVEIHHIYDPFYLEGEKGQSIESLKREFLFYIVNLYGLQKLLPSECSYKNLLNISNNNYWIELENIISPYLAISTEEINLLSNIDTPACLNNYSVPFANEMSTLKLSTDRYCIIGPRIALVGIGSQKKQRVF